VIEKEGKGLVSLIERGKANSKETRALLEEYLAPMLAARIDHLVLGCSHYPYLIPLLKELLPSYVKIIDSGEAVARQTKALLEKHHLQTGNAASATHEFFSNANTNILSNFLVDVTADKKVAYLDF